MYEELERRLARNEVLFRETNEAIERGQWPDDLGKVIRFRCECSRLNCGQPVEVTLYEYELVRRHPRRFVVAIGHEMLEIETVVDRTQGYVLVEKRDEAGEIAAATDPRG
jgi:hypothetical protein